MPLRKQNWGEPKEGETLTPEYVDTDKVYKKAIVGGVESSIIASIVAATWATWISFPHPVLFALYSSVQYFTFGFVFSGARNLTLETFNPPRRREPYINTASAALAAGFSATIFRGRNVVKPSLFYFSTGAFAVTHLIKFAGFSSGFKEDREPFTIYSLKKYALFRRIPDEEMRARLKADLAKVDMHIARIDGEIAGLRESK